MVRDIIQNHCRNRLPESYSEPTQNQITNDKNNVPDQQQSSASHPTLPFQIGDFGPNSLTEEQMSSLFTDEKGKTNWQAWASFWMAKASQNTKPYRRSNYGKMSPPVLTIEPEFYAVSYAMWQAQ